MRKDIRSISKIISKIERGESIEKKLLREIYSNLGNAHVIGVTGPMGVGKSSLINKLVFEYIKQNKKVGVIAIDPISPITGGAILGDRLRMRDLTLQGDVFIRSLSSDSSSTGLPSVVNKIINVLDASGMDKIIVETVGTGQTQTEIMEFCHTVVVVVMPKMGDETQMLKAGLLEIGDILVVNKADQENADETMMVLCKTTNSSVEKFKNWKRRILKTSALTGDGVLQLITEINEHKNYLLSQGLFDEFKDKRCKAELKHLITTKLHELAKRISESKEFELVVNKVKKGELDSYTAVEELLTSLDISKIINQLYREYL